MKRQLPLHVHEVAKARDESNHQGLDLNPAFNPTPKQPNTELPTKMESSNLFFGDDGGNIFDNKTMFNAPTE